MNEMTIKRTTSRARTPQQECHGKDCASGARNNYYLGKHLTPDSYLMEQRYSIDRRRLINRALHGSGVVYGFALSTKDPGGHSGELEIGSGLAFDDLGRELIQVHPTWFSLDNLLVLDGDGQLVLQDGRLNDRFRDDKCAEGCWMLTAHYAEKTIGHRTISDPCRCDRDEWDKICETVVYSLKQVDCEKCCEPWKCELHCCCPPETDCCAEQKRATDDIDCKIREFTETYGDRLAAIERQDAKTAPTERAKLEAELNDLMEERIKIESKRHARGGCACLCEDVTKLKVVSENGCMADVDDCTKADLGNGVELACLKLEKDKCGKWTVQTIVDACGPRRLVKRNELLFDLINGCDVTTIKKTGWAPWHRRSVPAIPFEEFAKALGWDKDTEDAEYRTRDFWVEFSRPVVAATLKPDVFAMAVMSGHSDDFWRTYVRVPIVSVETDCNSEGFATKATFFVGTNWLRDAVTDRDHMCAQGRVRVEIEVRGDLIVDCLGQQVDANSRGLSPYPSGNGSPGGTYFSSFTVDRRVIRERPKPPPKPQYEPEQAPAASAGQSDNRIR